MSLLGPRPSHSTTAGFGSTALPGEAEPGGPDVETLLAEFGRSNAAVACQLAAAICQTPLAGVRLLVDGGMPREAWHGAGLPPAIEDSPCSLVIAAAEPVAIADLHADPVLARFNGGLRAYAGVPIITRAGDSSGTVCVLDTAPRDFSDAEIEALVALAGQLAGGLELLALARTAALAGRQRDVAEAEAAESGERFQALVESSPLAIFALDPTGKPDFVSEGCALLFGTTGPDYDQDGWIPALHEEDHDRAVQAWNDATRTRTSLDIQYRIYSPERKVQEVVVNAAAMHAGSGEFRGWIGTITDVTEQVAINRALARSKRASERARAELELRNQELQALARSRDLVLAGISHEFRTPLTSITTFLQLLQEEDCLNDSQQQAVGVIARNTARLNQLVSDLLSAKQQPAEIEVHLQAVDLHEVAGEALGAAALRAQDEEVELQLERPTATVWAWADPKRVAQVLDSLLDNALKYTPAGGRITIRPRISGTYAEIEVSDTGPGIAVEELGRIFDSFYQGKAGLDSGRGSGLGLSIVERILDAQGAAVDVNSRVGDGTSIVISFPLPIGR